MFTYDPRGDGLPHTPAHGLNGVPGIRVGGGMGCAGCKHGGRGMMGLGYDAGDYTTDQYGNVVGPAPGGGTGFNWGGILQTGFNTGFRLAENVFTPRPTYSQSTGPNGQSNTQYWGDNPNGITSIGVPGTGFGSMSLGTLLIIGAVAVAGFMFINSMDKHGQRRN